MTVSIVCEMCFYALLFVTHQSQHVPRVTLPDVSAEAEGAGGRDEDDEGDEEGKQVVLLHITSSCDEHAHHTEGEQHLDSEDAEHLQGKMNKQTSLLHFWVKQL